MSEFAVLNVAAQAMDAQQAVVAAVGSNVANAGSTGYQAEAITTTESQDGGTQAQTTRITDAPTEQSILLATGTQAAAQNQASTLNLAQSIFPGQTGTGLESALDSLWSAWQSLASTPTNAAAQQQVISTAQVVAQQFNTAAAGLNNLLVQTASAQSTQVQQANQLIGQIAQLNQQIAGTPGSSGKAALENQQSGLIQQLAAIVDVQSSRAQTTGVVTLWNGGGSSNTEIVSPDGTYQALSSALEWGADEPVAGGGLAGYTAAQAQVQGYIADLNTLAASVVSQVNALQASGYTTAGTAGEALFTGSDASSMALAPAATAAGLASSQSGAAGDGSNAQAEADLGGTQAGGIMQDLAAITTGIGTDVSTATANAQSSQDQLNSLQSTGQAVWGVDLNQQAVQLEEAQQSYQADAQLLQVQSQMLDSLTSISV